MEYCCLRFESASDHELFHYNEEIEGWFLIELLDMDFNEETEEIGFLQLDWEMKYCMFCGKELKSVQESE